jgi:hypothetical protein
MDTGTPLKNARAERFAQARARGLSIADAANEAGWRGGVSGYGGTMSNSPEVLRRIAELHTPAIAKTVMTIEKLLADFVEQGTYDPSIFEEVTSPLDLRLLVDEPVRRLLVKGWKWDRQGRFILDLVDKEKAMDRIARHLSFYNDTLKVDVSDFDRMLDAAERAQDAAEG